MNSTPSSWAARTNALLSGIVLDLFGDVHRADTAVVAVVEPLVGLGTAEERQHLLKAPVGVAQLGPGFVVLASGRGCRSSR